MFTQAEPVYAGFWRRLAAFIIDLLIFFLISIPLRLLLSLLGTLGIGNNAVFFHYSAADLLLTAALVLYFTAFEGSCGATPGKRILGMRVVSVRTGRLGWFDAFYRETVGRFLNNLLGVGYLMLLPDREKRTLADRLCDTRVVLNRPKADTYSAPQPAGEPSGPVFEDLPEDFQPTGFAGQL